MIEFWDFVRFLIGIFIVLTCGGFLLGVTIAAANTAFHWGQKAVYRNVRW